ncbi:MAG: helix-turn-helix transcriptional regulator [Oscillospiraceae bacterium]|nr:helix-turn-helix transcriptional regulator [Oscillospiraceae bacterium]
MIANRQKLQIALARSCMTPEALAKAAEMPRPTVNNVISGRSVRPATLGRIARALGVDVEEIVEKEVDV